MRKLALLLVLVLIVKPVFGLSDSASNYNAINDRIDAAENITAEYQDFILNLNSQGALVSKSIELLSQVEDLLSQSKAFLADNRLDDANKTVEEAFGIIPEITLDARSSFKVNTGRLALEESLSIVVDARNQGYDVKNIEDLYYNASSIFSEAKQSYLDGDYSSIDPKVDSVLAMTDKISNEIEGLKMNSTVKVASPATPTGFLIVNNSWVSFPIVIIIALALILLKASRRKKELKGIEKLERIKVRLE